MVSRRFLSRRSFRTLALCAIVSGAWLIPAAAQTKHSVEGTPLDTLRNTHIRADVPEAKDFVKESRPPEGSMNYLPLTGAETEPRPKPLDAAGVKALQAELEGAAAKNNRAVHGNGSAKRAHVAKAKPAKVATPKAVN